MKIDTWPQCPYRVNDPLENIPYDLTFSEFKRYCEAVNPFIIAPGGEYRKPAGGCRLMQAAATSRAFSRYRGLYTMPTIDDMVQEAYIGMALYKDFYTKEPPADKEAAANIIRQAIRKHFKNLYRAAMLQARDFDNGQHNARIEPKQKPPKVLIDEMDFDPEREPESVKQANDIKKWRIGGISKEYYNRSIIYFYDEIEESEIILKPKKLPIENGSCFVLWPEDMRPGAPRKLEKPFQANISYSVDPYFESFSELGEKGKYITATKGTKDFNCIYKIPPKTSMFSAKAALKNGVQKNCSFLSSGFCNGAETEIHYKRTQIKRAAEKLKIEKEILYNYKRKSIEADLEFMSLLHAYHFPDHKPPDNKKIFFTPGAISYDRFADTGFIDGKLDLIAILREALFVINAMQQQLGLIMKLYYYQGLTQGEICALLHKSARKVQLARAEGMQQIKQRFIDYHTPADIEAILEQVRKLILNREIFPL